MPIQIIYSIASQVLKNMYLFESQLKRQIEKSSIHLQMQRRLELGIELGLDPRYSNLHLKALPSVCRFASSETLYMWYLEKFIWNLFQYGVCEIHPCMCSVWVVQQSIYGYTIIYRFFCWWTVRLVLTLLLKTMLYMVKKQQQPPHTVFPWTSC